jgi:hypothetical protein
MECFILLFPIVPCHLNHFGCDWLYFPAHAGCMSTARLSTSRLSRCDPLLFDSVSLLVQARLSLCLVGWMKEIKNKNIIPKKLYSKYSLVLFEKISGIQR